MTMVSTDVKLFYSAKHIVELPGVYRTDGTSSWIYDDWEGWFSDKKEACEQDVTCFVLQCQMSHTCWEKQIVSERYACLQTSGYICYSYSDPLFIPLIEKAQTSLAGSTDTSVSIYYGDAGEYLYALRQDESRYPLNFKWKDSTTRGVWVKKQECCSQCEEGKYSQFIDMLPCAACPAGQIHLPTDGVWDFEVPNCDSCAAGKYATADMTTCEGCAPGKISGEEAGECTLCPRGKYMSRYVDDYAAFDGTDPENPFHHDKLDAYKQDYCDADCHGCPEQQYRYNCTAGNVSECRPCESCP
ncbi:MAG: hypothetical protein CMI16_02955, partial [Opitutaceae bacterium]|nr:hypothetical protein [Opitutaceae bacterium]